MVCCEEEPPCVLMRSVSSPTTAAVAAVKNIMRKNYNPVCYLLNQVQHIETRLIPGPLTEFIQALTGVLNKFTNRHTQYIRHLHAQRFYAEVHPYPSLINHHMYLVFSYKDRMVDWLRWSEVFPCCGISWLRLQVPLSLR